MNYMLHRLRQVEGEIDSTIAKGVAGDNLGYIAKRVVLRVVISL